MFACVHGMTCHTFDSSCLVERYRGIATDKDFDPRNGDTSTVIKYPSDMPYMTAIYPDDWKHLVCVYNKEAGKKLIYVDNELVVDGNVLISGEYPGYLPAASLVASPIAKPTVTITS